MDKEKPGVCCIMIANGRPKLVDRAISSFKTQAYPYRHLLIFDTGEDALFKPGVSWSADPKDLTISYTHRDLYEYRGASIGQLRNMANDLSLKSWEMLCHWDSDDWSHPRRIEEQVALLQASGKQCVGYKDMLFYDTTPGQFCGAWLYRHPTKPLGTSLCYWRSAWEARPFPDLPKNSQSSGEDYVWLQGVNHMAVSSFPADPTVPDYPLVLPRMIASIHGQNTTQYSPAEMERQSEGTSWKRAAEWDEHCRKVMAL